MNFYISTMMDVYRHLFSDIFFKKTGYRIYRWCTKFGKSSWAVDCRYFDLQVCSNLWANSTVELLTFKLYYNNNIFLLGIKNKKINNRGAVLRYYIGVVL